LQYVGSRRIYYFVHGFHYLEKASSLSMYQVAVTTLDPLAYMHLIYQLPFSPSFSTITAISLQVIACASKAFAANLNLCATYNTDTRWHTAAYSTVAIGLVAIVSIEISTRAGLFNVATSGRRNRYRQGPRIVPQI
jgi:hypothetical protein